MFFVYFIKLEWRWIIYKNLPLDIQTKRFNDYFRLFFDLLQRNSVEVTRILSLFWKIQYCYDIRWNERVRVIFTRISFQQFIYSNSVLYCIDTQQALECESSLCVCNTCNRVLIIFDDILAFKNTREIIMIFSL